MGPCACPLQASLIPSAGMTKRRPSLRLPGAAVCTSIRRQLCCTHSRGPGGWAPSLPPPRGEADACGRVCVHRPTDIPALLPQCAALPGPHLAPPPGSAAAGFAGVGKRERRLLPLPPVRRFLGSCARARTVGAGYWAPAALVVRGCPAPTARVLSRRGPQPTKPNGEGVKKPRVLCCA